MKPHKMKDLTNDPKTRRLKNLHPIVLSLITAIAFMGCAGPMGDDAGKRVYKQWKAEFEG